MAMAQKVVLTLEGLKKLERNWSTLRLPGGAKLQQESRMLRLLATLQTTPNTKTPERAGIC